MRLGFSVRVIGKPGLRAYDGRRPQNWPHLSVSLAHLHDIFAYLRSIGVGMYRMAPELAPYATHPDWPALHNQLEECRSELLDVGASAVADRLRLSFHAPSHIALASADPIVVERSVVLLELMAGILDGMALPPEAVIVVHIGGLAGGVEAAIGRWATAWERLSQAVRRRLVLEHEDDGLTLPDALRLHAVTGVPLVFDYLHFLLNNPQDWSVREGLAQALGTWPAQITPKTHFATPRTELRAFQRLDEVNGRRRWLLAAPRAGHHADFLNPWEFGHFLEAGAGLRDFDVMLEAKAGDLALLRLRDDVRRYLPAILPLLDPAEVSG
jgi:UV DNA damage endonuclease